MNWKVECTRNNYNRPSEKNIKLNLTKVQANFIKEASPKGSYIINHGVLGEQKPYVTLIGTIEGLHSKEEYVITSAEISFTKDGWGDDVVGSYSNETYMRYPGSLNFSNLSIKFNEQSGVDQFSYAKKVKELGIKISLRLISKNGTDFVWKITNDDTLYGDKYINTEKAKDFLSISYKEGDCFFSKEFILNYDTGKIYSHYGLKPDFKIYLKDDETSNFIECGRNSDRIQITYNDYNTKITNMYECIDLPSPSSANFDNGTLYILENGADESVIGNYKELYSFGKNNSEFFRLRNGFINYLKFKDLGRWDPGDSDFDYDNPWRVSTNNKDFFKDNSVYKITLKFKDSTDDCYIPDEIKSKIKISNVYITLPLEAVEREAYWGFNWHRTTNNGRVTDVNEDVTFYFFNCDFKNEFTKIRFDGWFKPDNSTSYELPISETKPSSPYKFMENRIPASEDTSIYEKKYSLVTSKQDIFYNSSFYKKDLDEDNNLNQYTTIDRSLSELDYNLGLTCCLPIDPGYIVHHEGGLYDIHYSQVYKKTYTFDNKNSNKYKEIEPPQGRSPYYGPFEFDYYGKPHKCEISLKFNVFSKRKYFNFSETPNYYSIPPTIFFRNDKEVVFKSPDEEYGYLISHRYVEAEVASVIAVDCYEENGVTKTKRLKYRLRDNGLDDYYNGTSLEDGRNFESDFYQKNKELYDEIYRGKTITFEIDGQSIEVHPQPKNSNDQDPDNTFYVEYWRVNKDIYIDLTDAITISKNSANYSEEKTITSVTFDTGDVKKTYRPGQQIDLSQLKATFSYGDGTIERIVDGDKLWREYINYSPYRASNNSTYDYISGHSEIVTVELKQLGQNNEKFTVQFNITVKITPQSLDVEYNGNNEFYIDDQFQTSTIGRIWLVYDNNSKIEINQTDSSIGRLSYSCQNWDDNITKKFNKVGQTSIIVIYEVCEEGEPTGEKYQGIINVNIKPKSSGQESDEPYMTILRLPKRNYYVGDYLDFSLLQIGFTDKNGSFNGNRDEFSYKFENSAQDFLEYSAFVQNQLTINDIGDRNIIVKFENEEEEYNTVSFLIKVQEKEEEHDISMFIGSIPTVTYGKNQIGINTIPNTEEILRIVPYKDSNIERKIICIDNNIKFIDQYNNLLNFGGTSGITAGLSAKEVEDLIQEKGLKISDIGDYLEDYLVQNSYPNETRVISLINSYSGGSSGGSGGLTETQVNNLIEQYISSNNVPTDTNKALIIAEIEQYITTHIFTGGTW